LSHFGKVNPQWRQIVTASIASLDTFIVEDERQKSDGGAVRLGFLEGFDKALIIDRAAQASALSLNTSIRCVKKKN